MGDKDATYGHVRGYIEHGERRRRAALRLAAAQPGRLARVSLRPALEAPARARRVVASFVGASASEPLRFALQLVASELVENAVLYGSREEPVRLEVAVHRDWIELRVTNRGKRIVMSELRSRREDGGRGLEIVDALTWGWTIDTGPLETAVSVRLPIVDPPFERERSGCLGRESAGYELRMRRSSQSCGPESSREIASAGDWS
jgi:anti-sigma regulatory factor (Ser/Thr protein kinase)